MNQTITLPFCKLTLTAHPMKSSNLPTYGGVYLVSDQVGNILYAGKSGDIKDRHSNHEKKPGFERLKATTLWTAEIEGIIIRDQIEKALIDKYDPPLNEK